MVTDLVLLLNQMNNPKALAELYNLEFIINAL